MVQKTSKEQNDKNSTELRPKKKLWNILAIVFAVLGLFFIVCVWIDYSDPTNDFPVEGFIMSLCLMLIAFLIFKFRNSLSRLNGKKVLYWILILAAIGGIAKSCESCSSDNKETKTEQAHKNNSDGYYNGQYSFRRGMEWGELKIEGQAWIAQGVQEILSSLEPFGYSGVIRGTELVVTRTVYGYNATGEVYAEFDGNHISAGGWTFSR